MGTLTAAIAHEINQPLGAILSNAQAAIRFLNAEQSDIHHVREALDDIVSDDKRAAEVIRRLRNMLKKEDLKRETLELNNDIREIVDLLQSEMIINNASIKMDLDMELPAISGDRIQVQQVILNLLMNALEAVKDQPEKNREICLSTRFELPDKILISVSDSGPGIEAHEHENIFEAFYTTKNTGMGMGLPISKSIVEQHDGRIWVSKNPEGGAVFAISLPLRTQDSSEG
jgi:two-component system sensor kinase FixL